MSGPEPCRMRLSAHGTIPLFRSGTIYFSIITTADCGPNVTEPVNFAGAGFSGEAMTSGADEPSMLTPAVFAFLVSTL